MATPAEQQPSVPISESADVGSEPQKPDTMQAIGKHALHFEGFIPLNPVESAFDHIRYQLESKIIGQHTAIDAIIEALERSDMRLPSDKRPIACFAFLGPTGVGKSETAKVLAEILGDGDTNLIKLDCSNYSHGHEIASLIGSPTGYVGGEIEPLLSPQIVEKPGTVLLFDEIEKGSDKLYNIMLQIMGDGELTMAKGQVTSFRDTIIILTSNRGAHEMGKHTSGKSLGFSDSSKPVSTNRLEQIGVNEFKRFFRAEFVNRLNKLVVFHPLTPEGLQDVLDVKLEALNNEYEKQYGVRLSLSDAAKQQLVKTTEEEPENGARPVVRALENNILTIFGRYVRSGFVTEGTHVRVFHASEAPSNYQHSNDSQFIFTAQTDRSLVKVRQVPAPSVLLDLDYADAYYARTDDDPV